MPDAPKTDDQPVDVQAAEKPAPKPAKPAVKSPYFWGTGRRKTSVARVRVRPGSGLFLVNDRELKDYFPVERQRVRAASPLVAVKLTGKLDVFVNATGGGIFSQADAVLMGLARALLKLDPALMPIFRAGGFLTRDSREVERKKYGRAGARRSFQFSKR